MDHVRALFREYGDWLREDVCLQSFDKEIDGLPGGYCLILLATEDGDFAGCAALRELDTETAEMKRLFVRDAFRGRGVGAELIGALARGARELNYAWMRLDTLPKMASAQKLYEAAGFRDIERYNANASPSARFMELELRHQGKSSKR